MLNNAIIPNAKTTKPTNNAIPPPIVSGLAIATNPTSNNKLAVNDINNIEIPIAVFFAPFVDFVTASDPNPEINVVTNLTNLLAILSDNNAETVINAIALIGVIHVNINYNILSVLLTFLAVELSIDLDISTIGLRKSASDYPTLASRFFNARETLRNYLALSFDKTNKKSIIAYNADDFTSLNYTAIS